VTTFVDISAFFSLGLLLFSKESKSMRQQTLVRCQKTVE